MPRRRKVQVRIPVPDARYKSTVVSAVINKVLLQGKKQKATDIVYSALDIAAKKLTKDPFVIFDTAIKNITPAVEVRSKRVGGGNYQIPMEIKPHRRQSLAIRWMVNYARSRKGIPMEKALAEEIIDAFNKVGSAFKKKEETHKMAEANKAFSHFAR